MSVVGFDFGNQSCVVAVAKKSGIDIVRPKLNKREIPALVCFGGKKRQFGIEGDDMSMMNFTDTTTTISQIKRLIGRPFSDPELQRDLKGLPDFSVTQGPDGFPLIHAQYLGEKKSFTPTQVLGMIFSYMKKVAEKNLNAPVVDCCIGIPVYFNDVQRRAVLDAATIAGLHPLKLMHETTAAALAYGISNTDLQTQNEQLNVAFVDIGHSSMQVCISGFKKGQLKVLAHSFDRFLGGRDFDEALVQHFAEKFKADYNIDVFPNAMKRLQFRKKCEHLKKELSLRHKVYTGLVKEHKGYLERDEFEKICTPILGRVQKPLEKALSDAQLTVDDIYAVEVVGLGSRVPAITNILKEFFGKEPRRSLHPIESVSKGCALECAILSPTFKTRAFRVQEIFPVPIALTWKGIAQDSHNGNAEENQHTRIIFTKGNQLPSVKALAFDMSSTFTAEFQYVDVQEPSKISTYTIGPFQSTKGECAKIKVEACLNRHGIVSLQNAQLIEEEEEEESDVFWPKETTKKKKWTFQEEAPKKAKECSIPILELVYGAMLEADVQKAVEKEFEMAFQDRVTEETDEKFQAVYVYVNDMRFKVYNKLYKFVTEPEREFFLAQLQETEDWLCGAGEDETIGVYSAKLEELKKQGDRFERRYKEHSERETVVDQLMTVINWYKQTAKSGDPKYETVHLSEKQKVLNMCSRVENWLREKKQLQDLLPKHADPVLLSSDIRRQFEALDRVCRPILSTPSSPAPALAGEQQSSQGGA